MGDWGAKGGGAKGGDTVLSGGGSPGRVQQLVGYETHTHVRWDRALRTFGTAAAAVAAGHDSLNFAQRLRPLRKSGRYQARAGQAER